MNPNRVHNRNTFFKHTSAGTAKIILAGRKLRWSIPRLFNDPFDVPSEIFDGIDEQSLRHALVDRMNALIQNPNLPHPEHHSVMTRKLLEMFRRADDETKKLMILENEKSRNTPNSMNEGFGLLREQWGVECQNMRILCFTERWDSTSMWDRYSDGHKGALLEFACLDHLDSAWLMAKPMSYSDKPLVCSTVDGLASLMLYDINVAILDIMEEYTHTKTTDWAPEKEWRIASWKRPHESGEFSDYEFLPEELVGITLGASISDEDRTDFEAILQAQYPHVKAWQASVGGGRKLSRSEI